MAPPRPEVVPCTPLGKKAVAILKVCALERIPQVRRTAWSALHDQFCQKAVRRKVDELTARGYIDKTKDDWDYNLSWLTDKGRQTLEFMSMSG